MTHAQAINDDDWNAAIEQLAQLAETHPADLIAASAHRCERVATWLRTQKR